MFFSYDHEGGFIFHDTAEKAKAEALRAFGYDEDEAPVGYDEDEAPDGWHDEVESICWGEVRQKVTETSRRPADPGSVYDEHVEYALLDVK